MFPTRMAAARDPVVGAPAGHAARKSKLLESKLFELIRYGEDNDAISEKVHRLSVALLGARDFAGAANALYFHLREDFSVPHVALRVWGKSPPDGTPEGAPVSDAQRARVESMGAPQCGPAADHAFGDWFGDAREHVRSHCAGSSRRDRGVRAARAGQRGRKALLPGDGHVVPAAHR